MDLPLTEQSEDNSQWQSVNDIIGQLPVDQTGLSYQTCQKCSFDGPLPDLCFWY
jgi:hypothetical protein